MMRLAGWVGHGWVACGCVCLLLAPPVLHAQPLVAGKDMSGSLALYIVEPGDSLSSLAARFGIGVNVLARMNDLSPATRIKPGETLEIDNRHIVPAVLDDGIVINLPQRMLFRLVAGKLQVAYPVAVGKPSWPTPAGSFTIVQRQKDKTWLVPPSIQREMLSEGKPVLQQVPPGPDNPLGRYWLGLSIPGIGIHGTTAPQSIYGFRSHGCIRLHPDNIEQLFHAVEKGEPGTLIYQPVLLYKATDGRIFLEVHRDAYKKTANATTMARELADAVALSQSIDWEIAAAVIKAHDGLANDVTLDAAKENP